MAQAFEIPKEVTRAHSRALAAGSGASRRKVSATHFSRSPLPVRPRGRIGTGNMGLPPDRRKRIDAALHDPRPARFPARLSETG